MATKILKILNHNPTKEQLESLAELYGDDFQLVELPERLQGCVINSPSNEDLLINVAREIAEYIYFNRDFDTVILPAGSPAFQFLLAKILESFERLPHHTHLRKDYLFAHSERKIVEEEKDGQVIKTSVFKFKKWIIV